MGERESKRLGRRDVLKLGALAGGGAVLAAGVGRAEAPTGTSLNTAASTAFLSEADKAWLAEIPPFLRPLAEAFAVAVDYVHHHPAEAEDLLTDPQGWLRAKGGRENPCADRSACFARRSCVRFCPATGFAPS